MMNRSRMPLLLLALVTLATLFGSGCASRIDAGHVGIVVDLAGKHRGVQDYTVRTGWVFYSPWGTQVVKYPTYVQTVKWTQNPHEGNERTNEADDESITFPTSTGVAVNADVSLSYQLDAAKIPTFYVTFRSDDLYNFSDGFLHNVARDAFTNVGGSYTVEQMMSNSAAFLQKVQARVESQVNPLGVHIQQFGFIGTIRPPANVINAINSAQQAMYRAQQSQNELAQTQAEAAKEVAQAEGRAKAQVAIANGEAESNRLRAASLTPQIIEWQRLAVTDRWINRWNGHTPDVSLGGSTPGLMLNLPAKNE